jgi:hypothetical protein
VDVAAPASVLTDILQGALDGVLGFSVESDGKVAFDASQGFRVKLDCLVLGDVIERIRKRESFGEASLASMSDLLLLRAVTVADRGSDGDVLDFIWLLQRVVETGQFPQMDDEEQEWLRKALDRSLGKVGKFVYAAVLGL